jgi:hypothetical protein
VTETINGKRANLFLTPNDKVVPITIQGHVLGEELEDSESITYPLKNVKILVNKASGGEGVSVATLSDNRGFFSISPDYVVKGKKAKKLYVAIFKKKGYHSLTKLLRLPSSKASRLNVSLKRIERKILDK